MELFAIIMNNQLLYIESTLVIIKYGIEAYLGNN